MLFVYPTDTVWGIGAPIFDEIGNRLIREIKKNESHKPMSLMFSEIEQLDEYFNLSDLFTDSWLKELFKLGTTLMVSNSLAREEIPTWVTCGSEYTAIRCVSSEIIKDVYKKAKGPFTSTSLNLNGEAPIVETSLAKRFVKDNSVDCNFSSGDNKKLSGIASTIVLIEKGKVSIWREGANLEKVKKHAELLPA